MKRRDSFTPVDVAADGLLRRLARGETALAWLQARWDRIVGEPLSRKIAPGTLQGGRLTLRLLDPAWRKPVQATLPELERKLAREMLGAPLKVELEPEAVRRDARHGTRNTEHGRGRSEKGKR